MTQKLNPFVNYFGGKRNAAALTWARAGDPYLYSDPFCGGISLPLLRPTTAKIEVFNDKNFFLINAYRSMVNDPESIIPFVNWPISEACVRAAHQWLMTEGKKRLTARVEEDPNFYDPECAGRWLYGANAWIASGWCDLNEVPQNLHKKKPAIGDGAAGRGLHAIAQKRPAMHRRGSGLNSHDVLQWWKSPAPDSIDFSHDNLLKYFRALACRLRHARFLCGDWKRAVTSAVLNLSDIDRNTITFVFLDPPYADTAGRTPKIYSVDDLKVAHEAREWALANDSNPRLRIALCGLAGEHKMPSTWECVKWKGSGHGNQGNGIGRENSLKERIWFSPSCIKEPTLFDALKDSKKSLLSI